MTNDASDDTGDNVGAKLAPLQFLEGDWRGEGKGPYGPYKLEAHVERRGRWLLMTSAIIDSKSDEVTYVSTQVYGYDTEGLVLTFFDTAGSFNFRGEQLDGELRFDFTQGENWKRSQYWRDEDGGVRFKYESVYPAQGTELYEGQWIPNVSSALRDRTSVEIRAGKSS